MEISADSEPATFTVILVAERWHGPVTSDRGSGTVPLNRNSRDTSLVIPSVRGATPVSLPPGGLGVVGEGWARRSGVCCHLVKKTVVSEMSQMCLNK